MLGSGTIAGVGFTVSLVIANVAFTGQRLDEAKLGVLVAAIGASLASLIVYRLTGTLPEAARTRALLGTARQITDLVPPVDVTRDHVRGPLDAAVTVVAYGGFECPWTGMVAPTARELLDDNADIRYVWPHLPLHDAHPHAQLAAEAAEAAGEHGAFWPMHDLLVTNQDHLDLDNLFTYASMLGLDTDRFQDDLLRRRFAARVAQDIESADVSGVAGTPTFFINGRRHDGPQDLATLDDVITTGNTRGVIRRRRSPRIARFLHKRACRRGGTVAKTVDVAEEAAVPEEAKEIQWVWHGNKDRWRPHWWGSSWRRSRRRSGCCSSNRSADGCVCSSAGSGSPTARTSSCSTSRAATRSRTSRSPMSVRVSSCRRRARRTIATSGRRHGSACRPETSKRNTRRGNTPISRPTPPSCATGSPSPGDRWTPSTKMTSASWGTPATCTTASTSARSPGTWSSATATALSPTQGIRSRYTNRASRLAGMSPATTSTPPP